MVVRSDAETRIPPHLYRILERLPIYEGLTPEELKHLALDTHRKQTPEERDAHETRLVRAIEETLFELAEIFAWVDYDSRGEIDRAGFDYVGFNQAIREIKETMVMQRGKTRSNVHTGFVFLIRDPRLRETAERSASGELLNGVWVAAAREPWLTMERAMLGVGSDTLVSLMRGIRAWAIDSGFEDIRFPVDTPRTKYFGYGLETTIDPRYYYVEWEILGETSHSASKRLTHFRKEVLELGHPLLNKTWGRHKNANKHSAENPNVGTPLSE